MQRKKELSPMISEFIFYEDDASKDEKSNYVKLKIEIRQLIKNDFNRKILSEVLLDLQKDVSGDSQEQLCKLYQDLNLHTDAFKKLKSWRWEVISKAITDLTKMQVHEAYGFITKFMNDKRTTIRRQAEIAVVTLKHEGLNYFLDTTKHKISEWQQLKLLDVIRNQKDYVPPRFKAWLMSSNSYVVLFAIRLIKFYNQNDANTSLIELVKHKNNQIKQEAIGCIKEFHVVAALSVLKTVFWKSTTDVKIAILDTIGSLGSNEDIEFLRLIENKESNFYVKSKALSSINIIAPESIMPSEGILDTSGYQIPEDLPIEDQTINTETTHDDKPSVSTKSSTNSLSDKKESRLEEVKEAQILKETKPKTIHIEFLPLLVNKPTPQKKVVASSPNSANDALNNLPVNFEEVSVGEAIKHTQHTIFKEAVSAHQPEEQKDCTHEKLTFLPIVVANAEKATHENVAFKSSQESTSIHVLEVCYETVEIATEKQVKLEPIETQEEAEMQDTPIANLISYDQYNSPLILNIEVISEEVFIEKPKAQVINEIEVIDPHFLSFFTLTSKENILKNTPKVSSRTLPIQEDMTPKEEKKFKKIINELINFESKEELNEILDEFENSPLLEIDNTLIDINFVPLEEETENIKKQQTNAENQSDTKKHVAEIPKAELSDQPIQTFVFADVNSDQSINELLNDLSEMGDHRELPLLNELLTNKNYSNVNAQIKALIQQFSIDIIEPKATKTAADVILKPFNVFEDLFRTCDTESKLILLDEVAAVGDKDDIQFLKDLLNDGQLKIQNKAEQVLIDLRTRLQIDEDIIINTPIQNVLPNSVNNSRQSQLEHEERITLENTVQIEEQEIHASQTVDDIFELSFEITPCETMTSTVTEKEVESKLSQKTTNTSFIDQVFQFSNNIIDKLNG